MFARTIVHKKPLPPLLFSFSESLTDWSISRGADIVLWYTRGALRARSFAALRMTELEGGPDAEWQPPQAAGSMISPSRVAIRSGGTERRTGTISAVASVVMITAEAKPP